MNKFLNYFLCMFTAVVQLPPKIGKRIRLQACSLMRFYPDSFRFDIP